MLKETSALRAANPALMATAVFALGGCQVVKDIFGAGVGVGIGITVGVLALGGIVAAVLGHK